MASGRTHRYPVEIVWTGNRGEGTTTYRGYGREHEIRIAGKPAIAGSSDPAFRGDPACHNPEDLLVASLSACHMLWYLHLSAAAGVVVLSYVDDAVGTMVEDAERGGWFTDVTLRPRVTVAAGADAERARTLHAEAHARCFVANSVNFPVHCEAAILQAG